MMSMLVRMITMMTIIKSAIVVAAVVLLLLRLAGVMGRT